MDGLHDRHKKYLIEKRREACGIPLRPTKIMTSSLKAITRINAMIARHKIQIYMINQK